MIDSTSMSDYDYELCSFLFHENFFFKKKSNAYIFAFHKQNV